MVKFTGNDIKAWIEEKYGNGYSIKAIDKSAHFRFKDEKVTHRAIMNTIHNMSERQQKNRKLAMDFYIRQHKQTIRNDALYNSANRDLTDRVYWDRYEDEMGY